MHSVMLRLANFVPMHGLLEVGLDPANLGLKDGVQIVHVHGGHEGATFVSQLTASPVFSLVFSPDMKCPNTLRALVDVALVKRGTTGTTLPESQ